MNKNNRVLFEQLEPRILMSATPAPQDNDAAEIQVQETANIQQAEQLITEIAFVDTSVENYQALLAGIDKTVEIVEIHSDEDGLQKISETLAAREGISAIHIISHGAAGEIDLGSTTLNAANIDDYKDQLQLWT
ncbi:MAG: DUF4347 domain-containing protein, partial [Lentisphaeraceae bacterium]|nr:DUF4347 domain-containing protein [Lentisphaeraceae bacterium]